MEKYQLRSIRFHNMENGLSSCPEALASLWSGGRDELALVKLLARTGATSESGINNFTFAYVRLGGAGP